MSDGIQDCRSRPAGGTIATVDAIAVVVRSHWRGGVGAADLSPIDALRVSIAS